MYEEEERLRRAEETFRTFRHTSLGERAGWMRRAAELLEGATMRAEDLRTFSNLAGDLSE